MDLWLQLLIICPLVFFAGFVDSIAGGGGIISLPAYYAIGLPPHMALGTNKFTSTFGTGLATFRFIKSKKYHARIAVVSVIAALIGSYIGARLALYLDEQVLRYILLIALPILSILILFNKNMGTDHQPKPFRTPVVLLLSAIAGLVIGCYDGFFGPGTGTFLILIFHTFLGLEILTASGTAKLVNFASNITAVITFLLSGHVLFLVGIPAVAFSLAGNYIGSELALKKGIKIIRPAFLCVLTLLLIKIVSDLF